MTFSRPGQGLLARISQILLLAHLLVVAQGYPYGNSSVLSDEEQSEQSYLSKRARMSDFTTVPGFPTITKHISCDKKAPEPNFWKKEFERLSTMSVSLSDAAKQTHDLIARNLQNDNPTFAGHDRRVLDLFMALYGKFSWKSPNEKQKAKARAYRLWQLAHMYYRGLATHPVDFQYRIFCDQNDWVVNPSNSKLWMIKDLPLGPHMVHLQTSNVCKMPLKNDKGVITGYEDAGAFVTPASANIAPFNWIQICDVGFQGMRYSLTDPFNGGYNKVKGLWLYDVVYSTPERLLFHELGHGWSAFGGFTTLDHAYGWNEVVLLAQAQVANNDVDDYLPLKNADTFALWACAVILHFCNWGDGSCKPV